MINIYLISFIIIIITSLILIKKYIFKSKKKKRIVKKDYSKKTIHVIYSSKSGTSEKYANTFVKTLKNYKLKFKLVDLLYNTNYEKIINDNKTYNLIFFLSSYDSLKPGKRIGEKFLSHLTDLTQDWRVSKDFLSKTNYVRINLYILIIIVNICNW